MVNPKIGLQLSTVAPVIREIGLYETLKQVAEIGIHHVEVSQVTMNEENKNTQPEKSGLDETRKSVEIKATVSCDGRTGVEMEALTAVSTAALTVYDMCKAVQKDMVITDIRLLSKTGGVHGDYFREE